MKERLKAIRLYEGLSQEDFGKRIGIQSRAHISALEKGTRNITERIISDICRVFCINEKWLRTGEGNMHNEFNKEKLVTDYVNKILNSENQFIKNIFISVGMLPEEKLKIIEDLIKEVVTKKFKFEDLKDNFENDEITSTQENTNLSNSIKHKDIKLTIQNSNVETNIKNHEELTKDFKKFVSRNSDVQELPEEVQWTYYYAFKEERIKATLTEEEKRKLSS